MDRESAGWSGGVAVLGSFFYALIIRNISAAATARSASY